MNTHRLLLPLSLLLLAGSGLAQMSGNYTIDPNGSGATNFTTFTAAATALSTNGVAGPVVMSVAPGTHVESWSLSTIAGTSATNTVTFASNTPGFLKLTKLQSTAGNILTLASGVNNIVFRGLTFDSTNNAMAIESLYTSANRGVDAVEIDDCSFEVGVSPPSNYGAIRTQTTKTWNIHDCRFDVSGTAIYTQGASQMVIANNVFDNNGSAHCLSLWNSNRSQCRVFNNVVTGKCTSDVIEAWPSHYQIDFWHNTFVVETPGWVVRNRQCCTVAWNTFYNNIFVVTGTGGAIFNQSGGQLESDHNLFFIASGKIGRNNTTDYTTLASWSAAIQGVANKNAYDSNSVAADPMFASATDFHLTAASPAVGAAMPAPASFFPGHAVESDFDGLMRGTKKDIGAYELTGWRLYGAGCQGTASLVPEIEFGGNIAPGDNTSIELHNARPSSAAALAVGTSQISVSLGGSCLLLNNALFVIALATNATGDITIPVQIPASTAILGAEVLLQWGVTDPAAAGGIATSAGSVVRI